MSRISEPTHMSGLESILSKAEELDYDAACFQRVPPSVINSSLGITDMVDDVLSVQSEILQLLYSQSELGLFVRTSFLTQPSHLNLRIDELQMTMDLLSSVLSKRHYLVSRLQSPITDDVLPVEWEYRESFLSAIFKAFSFQDEFREVMSILQEFKSAEYPSADVDARLRSLKEGLVKMQQYHDLLLAIRGLVDDLYTKS
eukprot:ANDGO_03302.mRNA.1 hypothetical protein